MSEIANGAAGAPTPADTDVTGDTQDTAGDTAGDERLLEETAAELSSVEAALARLDDGTYGSCEVCGDALAPSLIDAEPLATRCSVHAG